MPRSISAPGAVVALVVALVCGGCSTTDEAPCTAAADCPSGRCIAGSCAPLDADAGPDARPDRAAEDPDAAPPDRAADGGPGDLRDASSPTDAGPDCADAPPRLARCDRSRVRTETCVDGRWQPGPCRAVPPVPCGSVCPGCSASPVARDQRFALRLPPDPLVPVDRALAPWVEELCDGCTWVPEGDTDRRAVRLLDEDGVTAIEECDGCRGEFDGEMDQREVWSRVDDGYRIERTRLPQRDQMSVDRYVLRPDGRIDRLEQDIGDDGPAGATVWTYGPTGLWTGFETRRIDGRLVGRAVVARDADGAVVRMLRYREGAEPEAVFDFDLGCWQCDAERCVQRAPPGCTHLAGMVPPVYLCDPGCPEGLAPAWLSDVFESRFALRRLDAAPVDVAVGARVDGEAFVWDNSPRPVDPLLYREGVDAAGGPCARLRLAADGAMSLVGGPCDGRPVLCRAAEPFD